MFENFNQLASLMKNVSNIKKTVTEMKTQLAEMEFYYKSPCGNVEVWVSGDFSVKKIYFDPAWAVQHAVDLPALITVSVNAAMLIAKDAAAKKMSEAAGGLNLPGLV